MGSILLNSQVLSSLLHSPPAVSGEIEGGATCKTAAVGFGSNLPLFERVTHPLLAVRCGQSPFRCGSSACPSGLTE